MGWAAASAISSVDLLERSLCRHGDGYLSERTDDCLDSGNGANNARASAVAGLRPAQVAKSRAALVLHACAGAVCAQSSDHRLDGACSARLCCVVGIVGADIAKSPAALHLHACIGAVRA